MLHSDNVSMWNLENIAFLKVCIQIAVIKKNEKMWLLIIVVDLLSASF